jgi:hypothetical protein
MRHDVIEAQVATTDLDAHQRKRIAQTAALLVQKWSIRQAA